MKRHFAKENIRMANNHMKRYSTSLVIREMEVKTTKRYHYTPTRTAEMKNSDNAKCWWGCGETGYFTYCWWNVIWYSHTGKYLAVSWKTKTINTYLTIQTSNYNPRRWSQRNKNSCSHKNLCTIFHSSFVISKNWKHFENNQNVSQSVNG